MRKTVDRRFVLIGATISVVIPLRALAEDIVQLQWGDLLPEGTVLPNLPVGIISRDGASQISQQPVSTGIRTDWNGQTVRLPGFIIPIEFESTSVAKFLAECRYRAALRAIFLIFARYLEHNIKCLLHLISIPYQV
ncbi:DUF3299 domain-containing protein [Ruegeria sp. HKCCA5929]|uniref:DUF3299 domain-containing protein n=1 Tax=Ruegeria sp. HKCCA5929 TaxID=2682988 RepID=UPI0014882CB6|nr:DUF3299 domain-containing protein [Ruegeria sp. HKCCA5929]